MEIGMFLQPATKPGRPFQKPSIGIWMSSAMPTLADLLRYGSDSISPRLGNPYQRPSKSSLARLGKLHISNSALASKFCIKVIQYVWRQNSRNLITWQRGAYYLGSVAAAPRRTRSSMEWISHRVNIRRCLGRRWTSS